MSHCPGIAWLLAPLSIFTKAHLAVDDRKLRPTSYKRGCAGSSHRHRSKHKPCFRNVSIWEVSVLGPSLPLSVSLLCFPLLAKMGEPPGPPATSGRTGFFPKAKARLDGFGHITFSQLVTGRLPSRDLSLAPGWGSATPSPASRTRDGQFSKVTERGCCPTGEKPRSPLCLPQHQPAKSPGTGALSLHTACTPSVCPSRTRPWSSQWRETKPQPMVRCSESAGGVAIATVPSSTSHSELRETEQGPTSCLEGPGGSWGRRKPQISFSLIRQREVGGGDGSGVVGRGAAQANA